MITFYRFVCDFCLHCGRNRPLTTDQSSFKRDHYEKARSMAAFKLLQLLNSLCNRMQG